MAPVVELARAYVVRYLAANSRPRGNEPRGYGPTAGEVASALGITQFDAEGDEVVDDYDPTLDEAVLSREDALESDPTIERLVAAFDLSPLDTYIVAVLLAPELDPNLDRAYAFALDDFTRKRPDIRFVVDAIACRNVEAAERVLRRFSDDMPLRRHRLLSVSTGDLPATMRTVRLVDRIVEFCREHDVIDELVRPYVEVSSREPTREDLVLEPALVAQIERAFDSNLGAPRLALVGPEGSGRALVVDAIHATRARAVMRIDLVAMVADGKLEERLPAALREVALRDAVGVLEANIDDEAGRSIARAQREVESAIDQPLVFLLSERRTWLSDALPALVELDVPPPTLAQRIELWRRSLPEVARADLETVASRYAFTGGTIARVAHRAIKAAHVRDPLHVRVTLTDLGDSARHVFSNRLGRLAQRIPIGFTWDDLVLPRDTLEGVREVVRFAQHRPFLLEEWGFASKLPYGRGVSAIMAGPPGTGKTMVAQLLARELGYELYRIDLSQIVNKYIGETEKNLGRVFDAAESAHAVLFFDEADSLFAKRTEVKSSNDRYANLEVNYLLQRMETYDGVTLLATNIEQGLDDAVKRRVRFTIQFELPDAAERSRLWRSMFPPRAPLAAEIDWAQLGARFEMAGGYIKKAAVRAALRAVETRRAITHADLLDAGSHEYREMGRIV